MHVGMSTFFQNLAGGTDAEVYRHELSMADRAEALGFDSVWSAEHHFTGYTMCPNVMQFLTWVAARTSRVQLGSMSVITPWHDPVRIAEEVAVLDQMSQGRVLLGLGRGLGQVEFNGFRLDMGESRQRFVEYTEALLQGLNTGHMAYDGQLYQQPPIDIRPAPYASFEGRVYASAVSPESARIMARLGIGVMIIAQKPWDKTVAELEEYRAIYREVHGCEAPKPIVACFVCCDKDAAAADDLHQRYARAYCQSALDHYEFANEGLAAINGYEYYGALAKNIARHGKAAFIDFLADLQVRGTPDAVFERLVDYRDKVDAGGFIAIFSFGGMPSALAHRNMDTFAQHVLPRLKALDAGARGICSVPRAAA